MPHKSTFEGTITLTDTHAVIDYPRRRGTQVSEILGRVHGTSDAPETIYLRTRVHLYEHESFGDWYATGAVSTVLVKQCESPTLA